MKHSPKFRALRERPLLEPAWRPVLRVADKHQAAMRADVQALLDDAEAAVDVDALESAMALRDTGRAERIALAGFPPGSLRGLAELSPLGSRILTVMEESGNATRCAVRPTGNAATTAASAFGARTLPQQLDTDAVLAIVGQAVFE